MSNNIYDINSYIENFPETVQAQLQAIRHIISKAAPKAKEVISYGIPTFRQKTNLVHYAGYKNHIGFYPGPKAIAAFKNDLTAYKLSKATVQFPLDKKLPAALITRIVKFCVKQEEEKAAKNANPKKITEVKYV
ncbi:MAG: DUF1801 domain-containing protein [Chitinophagaceae bacterium]|nr:DUF1801 domain-containing protein [Chitinophagaceae bacterium]